MQRLKIVSIFLETWESVRFSRSGWKKTDSNGCIVSDWARKHSDSECFCKVCTKTFSVAKEFAALEQHVATAKHRENWLVKQGPSQLRICGEKKSNADESQPTTSGQRLQLFSPRDATAKAELVWVLQCIASDFPASSCGLTLNLHLDHYWPISRFISHVCELRE